jgi:phosphomannomutase/phosphoglucomutase
LRRLQGRRLWGAVLLVAAVVVGVGVVLSNRYADHQLAEADAALLISSQRANQFGVALAGALLPTQEILERYAQDPRVVTALGGADDAARVTLGDALAAGVPGALRLRLIPVGTVEPDTSVHPPLTYAAIDLLRRAGAQETPVYAEIQLGGTADEHIAIVRRVPPSGTPIGFLHLALSPAGLRERFLALAAKDLPLELRQVGAGAPPLVIARNAVASRPDGVDILSAAVPGARWRIFQRAKATSASLESSPRSANLVLLLGGLVLAGALAARWWRRRHASVPNEASTVYAGALRAILAGEYPELEGLLSKSAQLPAVPVGLVFDSVAPAAAPNLQAIDSDLDESLFPPAVTPPEPSAIAPVIFRGYDIRGVAGVTLTSHAVEQIGRAIGSEAIARGQQTVAVARDGRRSSPELHQALVAGLRAAGRDVVDIGITPTPVLYFATHYLDTRTGVMLTGSHNGPEYNGLKIVLNGETLMGDAVQAIRQRIEAQAFTTGAGTYQHLDILSDYIRRISDDIPVALSNALKVVVDCGNAVAGLVVPDVLRALGHDVIELHCELDGEFPNHQPDPSQPENLEDLILAVKHERADLGLAFDGDGDRLGVVDRQGKILWADRQLMLFARDLLSRQPGAAVVYDVKCSRKLGEVIRAAGGQPIMWKSGHSQIKAQMQETGALLGGEMTGHMFFAERWYGFDDAIYAAARLLEILTNTGRRPEQVFAELPDLHGTPELHLDMPESHHAEFMARVLASANFAPGEITLIDGLRVDYADRWGLIRPSNTTPCLVLRFEGDDHAALLAIQAQFRELLTTLDPTLTLPF